MIKALFFKEWIKLRYFWCIPFIFAGAALADYHLTFKGVLSMHGAVDTWNGLIFKESIYFDSLQWAFIFGGIWLPRCRWPLNPPHFSTSRENM